MWRAFNAMQLIDMIALIDIRYPEKLDQFFHGYKFSLLLVPEKYNFVNRIVTPKLDRPFNARIESFGFDSSHLLVLQFVPITLALILAFFTLLVRKTHDE